MAAWAAHVPRSKPEPELVEASGLAADCGIELRHCAKHSGVDAAVTEFRVGGCGRHWSTGTGCCLPPGCAERMGLVMRLACPLVFVAFVTAGVASVERRTGSRDRDRSVPPPSRTVWTTPEELPPRPRTGSTRTEETRPRAINRDRSLMAPVSNADERLSASAGTELAVRATPLFSSPPTIEQPGRDSAVVPELQSVVAEILALENGSSMESGTPGARSFARPDAGDNRTDGDATTTSVPSTPPPAGGSRSDWPLFLSKLGVVGLPISWASYQLFKVYKDRNRVQEPKALLSLDSATLAVPATALTFALWAHLRSNRRAQEANQVRRSVSPPHLRLSTSETKGSMTLIIGFVSCVALLLMISAAAFVIRSASVQRRRMRSSEVFDDP